MRAGWQERGNASHDRCNDRRTRANALPILIAASVMMSLAMGMRQCLGLFLPPMTQTLSAVGIGLHFRASRFRTSYGPGTSSAGAVADRWGLRPVMVLGRAAMSPRWQPDGSHRRRLDVCIGTVIDRHRDRLHGIVAGDDRNRARRLTRAA